MIVSYSYTPEFFLNYPSNAFESETRRKKNKPERFFFINAVGFHSRLIYKKTSKSTQILVYMYERVYATKFNNQFKNLVNRPFSWPILLNVYNSCISGNNWSRRDWKIIEEEEEGKLAISDMIMCVLNIWRSWMLQYLFVTFCWRERNHFYIGRRLNSQVDILLVWRNPWNVCQLPSRDDTRFFALKIYAPLDYQQQLIKFEYCKSYIFYYGFSFEVC